jgi:DNA-binding MarR family transcriptional regulator
MVTTTTRWLSAGEQHCWRSFLNACQSLFGAIDAQLQRDSDLPHGYYEILVHLSEAPAHAMRMSQLADASTFSKSRLSHAVTRLEERGLVLRQTCPTDRRGQIARLTDEGFAVLAAAAPGHVDQVYRSFIGVLTPEQVGQLGEISAAIIAASRTGQPGACAEPDLAEQDLAEQGCLDSLDENDCASSAPPAASTGGNAVGR